MLEAATTIALKWFDDHQAELLEQLGLDTEIDLLDSGACTRDVVRETLRGLVNTVIREFSYDTPVVLEVCDGVMAVLVRDKGSPTFAGYIRKTEDGLCRTASTQLTARRGRKMTAKEAEGLFGMQFKRLREEGRDYRH